jgi:hypothetical protein
MWRESCAHKVGRHSVAVLALVCAAIVTLAVSAPAAAARQACAEAVLHDWTRGALHSSYSPECYEAAIDALPEDLRAYTTAADDIRRAGIAASRETTGAVAAGSSRPLASETEGADLRAIPTEVVALAALLAVLVSGGFAAALLRRRRGE